MITLQEQGGLSVWHAPFIFSQLCFGLPALIVHGAPLKGIANADSPLSLSRLSAYTRDLTQPTFSGRLGGDDARETKA